MKYSVLKTSWRYVMFEVCGLCAPGRATWPIYCCICMCIHFPRWRLTLLKHVGYSSGEAAFSFSLLPWVLNLFGLAPGCFNETKIKRLVYENNTRVVITHSRPSFGNMVTRYRARYERSDNYTSLNVRHYFQVKTKRQNPWKVTSQKKKFGCTSLYGLWKSFTNIRPSSIRN